MEFPIKHESAQHSSPNSFNIQSNWDKSDEQPDSSKFFFQREQQYFGHPCPVYIKDGPQQNRTCQDKLCLLLLICSFVYYIYSFIQLSSNEQPMDILFTPHDSDCNNLAQQHCTRFSGAHLPKEHPARPCPAAFLGTQLRAEQGQTEACAAPAPQPGVGDGPSSGLLSAPSKFIEIDPPSSSPGNLTQSTSAEKGRCRTTSTSILCLRIRTL